MKDIERCTGEQRRKQVCPFVWERASFNVLSTPIKLNLSSINHVPNTREGVGHMIDHKRITFWLYRISVPPLPS